MGSVDDRWGVIDEQSIAESRELLGVALRRDRMRWNRTATTDAIRQFADGVGDGNPLWRSSDYAASTRWGAILAPPAFLYSVDATIVAPRMPGVQWIYAGTRWRWYDAIAAGESFDVTTKLTKVEEKSGRRFGLWVLQTGEIVFRGEDGRLLATAEGRVARTPRQRDKSTAKSAAAGKPRAAPPPPNEGQEPGVNRRGPEPRYWEDVQVGDSIPPVARPLTLHAIYRWYMGAQGALHYGGAHGDAVRYRRRHDDFEINKETGAKDSAARGHFSAREGRAVGMGGTYDVGLQRIAWVVSLLTDWMGDDAHLAEVDVDVVRPNLVGNTTVFVATVTARWIEDNAFVSLSIEGRDQEGAVSTRGTATVALPSREHGPVELPLFDGDRERWLRGPESRASVQEESP